MMDELDALKAALKATPAADPAAKATAIRLAMENFDRLQGSAKDARLSEDRPARAGFLNGVRHMLSQLSSRPILTATTSVAALCLGVFVVLPELQKVPLSTKQPELTATPPVLGKDDELKAEKPDLGRADQTVATTDAPPAPPVPVVRDEIAQTEAAPPVTAPEEDRSRLVEIAPTGPDADKQAGATAAPKTVAPAGNGAVAERDVEVSGSFGKLTMGDVATGQASDGLVGGTPEGYSVPATSLAEPVLPPMDQYVAPEPNTEAFNNAPVNPVKVTAEEPVSTFSVDVDTASYGVVRSSLNGGYLPPAEAVRVEEMVNYFPYNYPAPEAGGAPFTNTVTVMQTPWNPNTRLVHIGLQGEMPAVADRPALNLVFLIDTSGSMEDANKLPLLKRSLSLMLGKLRPEDRVAIVAYAGSAGEVLAPTPASDRNAILNALDRLQSGGSTAGAEGLALAYQVAEGMKRDGAVSRVLLATDGDFNVGISDPEELKTYVSKQRESGTYLSVLGFGRGNLDDATMQTLAQNGNGTASYIDTLAEAQKVLVDQLTGALFPIADDVKIQVEWNPAQVAEYRLIGYETRALKREDFNNDKIDAGEIGAGLQVTALYEVTAPGSAGLLNDPLRYGKVEGTVTASSELGFLRLRYKDPGQTVSKLIETPIVENGNAGDDARFAAAIAGFGQLLQHSPYLGDWGWDQAIALAQGARGADEFGYRIEAVNLMRLAQSLDR